MIIITEIEEAKQNWEDKIKQDKVKFEGIMKSRPISVDEQVTTRSQIQSLEDAADVVEQYRQRYLLPLFPSSNNFIFVFCFIFVFVFVLG